MSLGGVVSAHWLLGMVAWLAGIQLLQAVVWLCCAHAKAESLGISCCLCYIGVHCHEVTHAVGRVAPSVFVLTAAAVSRPGCAASSHALEDMWTWQTMRYCLCKACARLPLASLI